MERSITMPKLGMTMTEGEVLHWLYQEGDMVEKGEPLVEVMTDKVNLEMESPFSGQLTRILAQEGAILPVGAPLAVLVDEIASQEVATQPAAMIPSSTLATGPVPSTPAAKRIAALHTVNLHDVLQTGTPPPLYAADVLAFVESKQGEQGQKVRATPVAQKMAREHQLDLTELSPARAGAKVTRADVEAHLAQTPHVPLPATTTANGQLETPKQVVDQQDSELIPLTPVRRVIAQRMLTSVTTMPHIYLDTEIDMTEAQRCREQVGRVLKEQGERAPSLTAIILRAVAAALVRHPEVNGAFAPAALDGKDAIRRWHAVHIGIAVDTEQALLTPVIRNAHQQTLPELARELLRLTQAARQGTLKPEEMANATFTISNLGMYDIDTFHAIIAPGQSAILAVGKTVKRGVVIEDAQGERLEIRPIMKVSLSADHRVLDGATGSRFLHRLKTVLETPYLLL